VEVLGSWLWFGVEWCQLVEGTGPWLPGQCLLSEPADATATALVAASTTITQPSTPSQSADTQPTAASPTDASRHSSPRRDPSASVLEVRPRVNLRTLADVESGCKQDTSGLPKGP